MLFTWILLITSIFCIYFVVKIERNKNSKQQLRRFPPGPKGWPWFGNLFDFRSAPLNCMLEWKKKYGNIVGVQFGEYKVVVFSELNMIKEALNDEAFNARATLEPLILFADGLSKGTMTSVHGSWDDIRRYTIKQLSGLGFGKKCMEIDILDNVDNFIQQMKTESKINGKCQSIDLYNKFYVAVSSNVWYILTGKFYSVSKYRQIEEAFVNLSSALWLPMGSFMWFAPTLTNWFPSWTGWKDVTLAFPPLKHLLDEKTQPRFQSNNNENENDNDSRRQNLIDAYITTINATTDPTSPFYGSTAKGHMKSMIFNLLETAGETVNDVLNWSLLYLALYPQVQEKLYTELVEVIGLERSPSLADKQNLPYTKAFILELFRITSISNFREAIRDTEFHGYFIPKGTVIIGNLYGLHHEPEVWGDPEDFRPDRFLVPNPPNITPFGIGLRTCVGQTYTRNHLFLFLTSLCLKCKFSLESEADKIRMTPEWITKNSRVSLFRLCPPFKSKVTFR